MFSWELKAIKQIQLDEAIAHGRMSPLESVVYYLKSSQKRCWATTMKEWKNTIEPRRTERGLSHSWKRSRRRSRKEEGDKPPKNKEKGSSSGGMILISMIHCSCIFLMGLDEVYVPIRSIILTTDPIPGVKGDFATLSRDESYRNNQSHIVSKNGSKDESSVSSNSFTNEQYKRLMALINEKSSSGSIPANIVDSGARQHMTYTILNMFNVVDVFNLNMTVGHPNGTKAVVTHTGSLKLTDKIIINDVLVVSDYQDYVLRTQVGTDSESNGLYFLNTDLEDNCKSDDPYDDGKDKDSEKSKGINPTSFGVSVNPDKQDSVNLKRSSWKAGMP
ncbi:hypothetical protein Tco_1125344, partial [Tanacetum coccineum]